ncbi:Dipeptidyl aminopeptidase/acylaminoacyl peptidase [Lysobacter sp. cf310]|nr:Dipeptidyl aminopeptidase/acylaminoacyl peptidase [Lysobacter sp. cf310]
MAILAASMALPAAAQVDLDAYLRKDRFGEIKLSPTGAYYAATMPGAERTALVVIRRADKTITAKVSGVPDSDIHDFAWVNDERLVVAMAERFSALERPSPTGELYAINADGSGGRMLIGHRDSDLGIGAQSVKLNDFRAAALVDDLPQDDRNVLVSIQGFGATPETQIDRLDVYTGRRTTVATAPVARASFVTDAHGEVRFAVGAGDDNASKLYYRDKRESAWRLLNDEAQSHRAERPLGFAADGRTAYLQVEQASGPDAIVALDTASGERKQALRDAVVDPHRTLYSGDGAVPVGAQYMQDKISSAFFEPTSAQAVLYRKLERAFPGLAVRVVSSTRDERQHLVYAHNDRNPGDYFLYDATSKEADRVFSRAEWLDPGKMAGVRGIEVRARDGLALHGYLTLPAAAPARSLPTVVLPHGGPIGIYDEWGFDRDAQLLAAAGYAVLQINYRGSGNYGRAFLQAGAREWGARMQDDLSDATRWLIEQGIADPKRICIYGASYGGYAALMGVAREPDLYRCAVGYVGVYDLPTKYEANADVARWMRTWSNDWMGTPADLAQRSPNRMATRIKAPVFLAAGGKDSIAPIKHSKLMEKALTEAGVPVETLYYSSEGHGFYTEEHQREFYQRLLDFLSRHIGGAQAK